MSKYIFISIPLFFYSIHIFSMDNGHDVLQNQQLISIVCKGPHQIFDFYNFPLPHVKLQSTTSIRSSYGWPKRGGNFYKGNGYALSKNHPIQLDDNPSSIARKVNEILPATLFEEEYSPVYKTYTPNDMFEIVVDVRDRQAISLNSIHRIYSILGFSTELEPRPTGLRVALACKEFPTLPRIKKLKIPLAVYTNIMQLPQKILIHLKEYITNAYYKYTGFDELVRGKFTSEEELNKWILESDSNNEIRNWIQKHKLDNKLYFKKGFSNDPYYPEIYTMVNPNVESIWKLIEPIVSQEKDVSIVKKLYAYLELLTIWEVFRNINKIQREHCRKK